MCMDNIIRLLGICMYGGHHSEFECISAYLYCFLEGRVWSVSYGLGCIAGVVFLIILLVS